MRFLQLFNAQGFAKPHLVTTPRFRFCKSLSVKNLLKSLSYFLELGLQKEIKGCYRFLNNKALGHSMLQQQHYENVLNEAGSALGRVLFIQDGSELIYNNLKWTELGPTADSSGNGIMFHSCLTVKFEDEQPQIIGLSGQKAWIREEVGTGGKMQQEKESGVWQEMIELFPTVDVNG